MGVKAWLVRRLSAWLTHETASSDMPMCDFGRLSEEIRPCDVLLVEGRSRVSNVIKKITQSAWTHSALYIGRLRDIQDPSVRELVRKFYDGSEDDQLLVEAMLGQGTIISPLSKYCEDHLRICRPRGLSHDDAHRVMAFAVQHLGTEYDLRQLIDLARFMYPYSFVPRRWRSTLFSHHPNAAVRTVCSSMIAAAFSLVHYPILPVVQRGEDGQLQFFKRNTRLYTPRDFDYSPYFDIIKYPLLGLNDLEVYRQLPWNLDGVVCNGAGDCYVPGALPPVKEVMPAKPRRVLRRGRARATPAAAPARTKEVAKR